MSAVITVENLGKKYFLRHQSGQQPYVALRDVIADTCRNVGRKLCSPFSGISHSPFTIHHSPDIEEFWALKGVSFEVKQGDRIGIIGRNGAGKSTLLKILSRITEPTVGSVRIRGRVASLLEVGTGFHPELTGRENIYLNGAILGMGRAEIKKKFDEIVDFAEIEKFLDTPVKRYSSGMYVRLAFAVAAHLEPEILVVDEVLAVGDAQFQKKCLGKMKDAGKEGRTVIFVSHNMGVIAQLCGTCILFESGQMMQIGDTAKIVDLYMRDGSSLFNEQQKFAEDIKKPAQYISVSMMVHNGISTKFSCDNPIDIILTLAVRKYLPGLYGYLGIDKTDGTRVLVSDSFDGTPENTLENLSIGTHTFKLQIPARTLGHGEYLLYLSLACPSADNINVDVPGYACKFVIDDFTSNRGNQRQGFFSTIFPWEKCDTERGYNER